MSQSRDKLLSTSMAMLSCKPPTPLCCLLQSPLPPNKLSSQLCKDVNRAHFQSQIQTLPCYKGSLGTPPEPCISPACPPIPVPFSGCPGFSSETHHRFHPCHSWALLLGCCPYRLPGPLQVKSRPSPTSPLRRQDPPPALPSASAAVVSQKHVLMHPVILFVLLWVAFTPRTALSV